MPYITDTALDLALDYINDQATILYICSSEPADYAGVAATVLGNKTPPVIADTPSDRTGGGREVVVSAITDGTVTATGTASHWCLVSGSALLASDALDASQGVTSGNTFTLEEFAIGIPDAV